MYSTSSSSKRIGIWCYGFLSLVFAVHSAVNLASSENFELNGRRNQSSTPRLEGNPDPYYEDHETNYNFDTRPQPERRIEQQKPRRKPSEDCQTRQAEILQRLRDQFLTPRASNNTSALRRYQYLTPHSSSRENGTHFSLEQLEKFSYFDNEHVPMCTPAGRYSPVQCHKIGYCWCVNKYGQAIKNSASEFNKEPNCDPKLYESEDLESITIEGRSSRQKYPSGGSSLGSGSKEDMPLDLGEDDLNSFQNAPLQEDDFTRRVKASQEPSLALVPNECTLSRDNAKIRASRHSDKEGIWIPDCDADNPNLYAQKQCHKSKVCWCVEQVTGLPLRTNEPLSVKLNLNCTGIRSRIGEDTLITLKHNRQRLPTSSHSYYQGFGDSCDADQRADFVRSLLNQFRQHIAEHLRLNPLPSHLPSINPQSLADANISTWKFNLIDTDHNGTLNDREWSRFRNNFKLIDKPDEIQRQYSGSRVATLKIMRHQRRCWRAFLNYCGGGDILVNSVNLKQWTNCTELPSKDIRSPNHDLALLNVLAHNREAAIMRSKSRNPFSSLLKPD